MSTNIVNLHYGDLVSFKGENDARYMCADGIYDLVLGVIDTTQTFEDCLFEICHQLQYSASTEYEEFYAQLRCEKRAVDEEKSDESDDKQYLEALLRGKENENKMNEKVLLTTRGDPVCFGDTIQLRHLKSRKFITIRPDELARDEKENTSIGLSIYGSQYSWLQIQAKNKIDRNGEHVMDGAELNLKVAARATTEFLHVSSREPSATKLREVNASMDSSTNWLVGLFQSYRISSTDQSFILGGNLVIIRDQETSSVLAPLPRRFLEPIASGDYQEGMTTALGQKQKQQQQIQNDSTDSSRDFPTKRSDASTLLALYAGQQLESIGDAVLRHQEVGVDADAVWVVQSKSIVRGGVIDCQKARVHLRHLTSGKYLCLEHDDITPYFALSNEPSKQSSSLRLDKVGFSRGSTLLMDGDVCQLRCSNIFLIRGETIEPDDKQAEGEVDSLFFCDGVEDARLATNLTIQKYKEDWNDRNAQEHDNTLDIYVAHSAMLNLVNYLDLLDIEDALCQAKDAPKTAEVPSIWIDRHIDQKALDIVVAMTICFVRGHAISSTTEPSSSEGSSVVKTNKRTQFTRQNLLRQFYVLDLVLAILYKLRPVSECDPFERMSELTASVLIKGSHVINSCLKLLLELVKDNELSRAQAAEHLPLILTHVATDPLAASVTTELLSINRSIQAERIGVAEISKFVVRMKTAEMNARFLRLLQSCCLRDGKASLRNQDIVYEVLFVRHECLLISILPDYSHATPFVWDEHDATNRLYVENGKIFSHPESSENTSSAILGAGLFVRGQPRLDLAWTSHSPRYSVMKLFGRMTVDLVHLFRDIPAFFRDSEAQASLEAMLNSGQPRSAEVKQAVAAFLCAQLYLTADMCFDRNYRAIEDLEELLPFDVLFTMLQLPEVSEALRGSALRLIMALYVDRAPQKFVTLPLLTRKLSDLVTQPSQKQRTKAKKTSKFALLQVTISRYLRTLQGENALGEYALQVLRALKMLLEMDLYDSKEMVHDVMQPILNALERRDVTMAQSSLFHSLSRMFHRGRSSFDNISVRAIAKAAHEQRRRLSRQHSASSLSMKIRGLPPDAPSMKLSVVLQSDAKELKSSQAEKKQERLKEIERLVALTNSWQARLLIFLDSMPFVVVMMVFTVFTVAIAIVAFSMKHLDDPIYMAVEIGVVGVFATELVLRAYSFVYVYSEVFGFIIDYRNQLDLLVVLIATAVIVVQYVIGSGEMQNGMKIVNALRFVRMLRLVRFVVLTYEHFFTVVTKENEVECKEVAKWEEPARYRRMTEMSINVMVEMVGVLRLLQAKAEDWAMQSLLRDFTAVKGMLKEDFPAARYFDRACLSVKEVTMASTKRAQDILVDLLMYNDAKLVQAALEVFMNNFAFRVSLLQSMRRVQLLENVSEEAMYDYVSMRLNRLRRAVDLFAQWGGLTSPVHADIFSFSLEDVVTLTQHCRTKSKSLIFNESYEPNKRGQNVLRNLGCIDLCFRILSLITTGDCNGGAIYRLRTTRKFVTASNRLLQWLVVDNPSNQLEAFKHLDELLDTVDEHVDSDKAIAGILSHNEELIKAVSRKYIAVFMGKLRQRQWPRYLNILDALMVEDEGSAVVENQFEFIRHMSQLTKAESTQVLRFFVPTSHHEYQRKINLMSPFLDKRDVSSAQLPFELSYHLELLRVLGRCAAGRVGSIEAKIQSTYNYADVLEAIMDDNCLLLGRVRLAYFFLHVMVEVETRIIELTDGECMWRFLDFMRAVLQVGRHDLEIIEKNDCVIDETTPSRQKIEFLVICVRIIHSYFAESFAPSLFRRAMSTAHGNGIGRMHLTKDRALSIMRDLGVHLTAIYDLHCKYLGPVWRQRVAEALAVLNGTIRVITTNGVASTDSKTLDSVSVELFNAGQSAKADRRRNSNNSFGDLIKVFGAHQSASNSNIDVRKGDSSETSESSFEKFVALLATAESLAREEKAQYDAPVDLFLNLPKRTGSPSTNEDTTGQPIDVRFEPLIAKLVLHIQGSICIVVSSTESTKSLSEGATRTTEWLLDLFRAMMEKLWGITIYERDDGSEVHDQRVAWLIGVFNECMLPQLCIDLIAKGIDESVQVAAIKLLIAILFKEGGNLPIQLAINSHLMRTGSDMFFEQLREWLEVLKVWYARRFQAQKKRHERTAILRSLDRVNEGTAGVEDSDEYPQPDKLMALKFMQLMCEGHYEPNQDILREQPNNLSSYNLLGSLAEMLSVLLEENQSRTVTQVSLRVAATILETIQGPAKRNQSYYADQTKLIECMNRRLRMSARIGSASQSSVTEELELKKSAVKVLQALLEGQGKPSSVFDRMLSVVQVDVVQLMSDAPTEKSASEDIVKAELSLKIECRVFLQMLCDYSPALRDVYERKMRSAAGTDQNIASIEVIWNHQIQRRFFLVPKICQDLSLGTRSKFVHNVDRTSQESKLKGLLKIAKFAHREMMHQQRLKEWGVSGLFSPSNHNRATWLTFAISLVINCLYISYYTTENASCTEHGSLPVLVYNYTIIGESTGFCTIHTLRPDIRNSITSLNSVIVIASIFTLILYVVVRVPVLYLEQLVTHKNAMLQAAIACSVNSMLLYYLLLVLVAASSIVYSNMAAVLLLDIVAKDTVAQEVLNAVYRPWKQIVMTLLLMGIIIYIYAFITFFWYNNADMINDTYLFSGDSLWSMFKLFLRYGLPQGTLSNYGITVFDVTTTRYILDLSFYAVCFVMLNIIKGIVIDTFVGLRLQGEQRRSDTLERCFICGIDQPTFDRILGNNKFREHIKQDHYLWNYVYFAVHLWEQDKDDDDGLDSFLRKKIDAGDISWFPVNRAICLTEDKEASPADPPQLQLRSDVMQMAAELQMKVRGFRERFGRQLDRVDRALNYAPSTGPSTHNGEGHEADDVSARRRASSRRLSSTLLEYVTKGGLTMTRTCTDNSVQDVSDVQKTDKPDPWSAWSPSSSGAAWLSHSWSPQHFQELSLQPQEHQLPEQFPQEAAPIPVKTTSFLFGSDDSEVHMNVVKVFGLDLTPALAARVTCRITTDVSTTEITPTRSAEGTVSLSVDKNGLQSVHFDMPTGSPPLLVHRGPLGPESSDVARIQVIYSQSEDDKRSRLLGAVDIPISALVMAAAAGHGYLEGHFTQCDRVALVNHVISGPALRPATANVSKLTGVRVGASASPVFLKSFESLLNDDNEDGDSMTKEEDGADSSIQSQLIHLDIDTMPVDEHHTDADADAEPMTMVEEEGSSTNKRGGSASDTPTQPDGEAVDTLLRDMLVTDAAQGKYEVLLGEDKSIGIASQDNNNNDTKI